MISVRAAFVFAFTILVSVGAVLLYLDNSDRFEMAPGRQGLYIFDKKTTATNFCDTFRCIGISPEFIMPKKVDVVQIPGVVLNSQIQQPTPTIASLMMPPQQPQLQLPAGSAQQYQATPAPQPQEVAEAKDAPASALSRNTEEISTSNPAENTENNDKLKVVEDEDMGAFIDDPQQPGDE